jgi:hypothetical protein
MLHRRGRARKEPIAEALRLVFLPIITRLDGSTERLYLLSEEDKRRLAGVD